ncbi:MAG: lipid-A-disaccharide synthase [Ignavibacteriales bacterium]|nr:lipid-A-disaccharide synthase [Ignavibacteriales bacterium]
MVERVLIIAGEASGDAHGAEVVRELRSRQPNIDIFGIGGDKMKQAGMKLTYHIREMSFMGFVEVIKHLPLIRSVEKSLERLMEIKKPAVVVLIDYPGFNLRFARIAKKYGAKVVYYISPQVWAWKKGRVKKMKSIIDKMLVVFPFEVPIYEAENIPVEFVGHPLIEEMHGMMEREQFYLKFRLEEEKKFIAVIPGSRKQEIHKLFPVMLNAAIQLAGKNKHVVVAVAPNLSLDEYLEYVPHGVLIKFIQHATHEVMKYAEFAFVTSGTATLETACNGTPMIVVYKTSPITYWIARLVVRIKNIALVNIVAGKTIVPELIQGAVTVNSLVKEAKMILKQPQRIMEMKVKEKLGSAGAASKVADTILSV